MGAEVRRSQSCFRTALKARARTIPPAASNASFRCVQATISRSPIARRRPTCFICCVGRRARIRQAATGRVHAQIVAPPQRAVSGLPEFAAGSRFKPVIGLRPIGLKGGRARRPVHRQGLLRPYRRRPSELRRSTVAIVRLEQLYPFPEKAVSRQLRGIRALKSCGVRKSLQIWVHGATGSPDREDVASLGNRCEWPHYVGRPENASTAIGTTTEHDADQLGWLAARLASVRSTQLPKASRRDGRYQQK